MKDQTNSWSHWSARQDVASKPGNTRSADRGAFSCSNWTADLYPWPGMSTNMFTVWKNSKQRSDEYWHVQFQLPCHERQELSVGGRTCWIAQKCNLGIEGRWKGYSHEATRLFTDVRSSLERTDDMAALSGRPFASFRGTIS